MLDIAIIMAVGFCMAYRPALILVGIICAVCGDVLRTSERKDRPCEILTTVVFLLGASIGGYVALGWQGVIECLAVGTVSFAVQFFQKKNQDGTPPTTV